MSSAAELIVQAVVGFGSAGIGAWSTLHATKRQMKVSADAVVAQLAAERMAERDAREEERKASMRQALVAAREELRVNTQSHQTYGGLGWCALSTEFTHRVLLLCAVVTPDDLAALTNAYLAGETYNTQARAANRMLDQQTTDLSDILDATIRSMKEAMDVLDRLLTGTRPLS